MSDLNLICGHDSAGHLITLRPPRILEAPIHRGFMADPAVTKYLGWRAVPTLKQERDWLREQRDAPDKWLWSIWADEVLVGNAGLRVTNVRTRMGNTGIVIGNRDYWGLGIATKVFARRAQFAFTEAIIPDSEPDHHFEGILTAAFPPNRGSWHAAEKNGYVRWGVRPRAEIIDGVPMDLYEAYLSRERWTTLNPDLANGHV